MHRVRDDGSPSQAMLSSFAVLKLPTKAAVPANLPGDGQKVYVNYVRIAQTRFGWPFKIIPLAHYTTESSRCLRLEASEVHSLIAMLRRRFGPRWMQSNATCSSTTGTSSVTPRAFSIRW